ncbi:MAG: hypothetical protein J1F71_01170 [Clostridiales bacterium]|nr:hypothetical protein [Clostridiales bacterium]
MNENVKKSIAATLAAACALSVCSCGKDGAVAKSTVLGTAATAQPLSHAQNIDSAFCSFKSGVEDFSARFAAATYSGTNYAVSPVSVYMALSLAAACADGQTKTEILDALGTDGINLAEDVALLYRSLNEEYTVYDGYKGSKVTGMIRLGNSVWVNSGTTVKQSCIEELAEKFYCYSYSADFKNDNQSANQAVREFVSEQTKGLINKDFELSADTLFALINTLYLKDVWRRHGEDLFMTDPMTFSGKNQDKTVKFLSGYYCYGRALVTDEYSAFYTTTANGNRLKFIVPNDGYTIDQVFTAENIFTVNTHSFSDNAVDHDNKLRYHTRCLFPEYKAKFDKDVAPVLKNDFGIKQLFDAGRCKLTSLTDERAYCSKVRHVTDLTVNKKGIEGAAVTVEPMTGAGAPGEDEYEDVYQTFTVDKSFGFIITNYYDTTLFSGVITDL